MSRAKPVAERVPNDSYQTPFLLAQAIMLRLHDNVIGGCPTTVVEPSAGSGAFVRAARREFPDARISAVEPYGSEGLLVSAGADRAERMTWESYTSIMSRGDYDCLVVGNPPYRLAEDHVLRALDWMRYGDHLAFLLRLNFLGSRKRLSFWNRNDLFSVATVIPRPSFTGAGSDATEYALFVWRKGYDGEAAMDKPIAWDKRRTA